MIVKQIRIEGLGNSSYLVVSEEAQACAIVDPVRDVDLYMREAESLGVKILYSLETHVHNDFVSGSRELAARTDATVCASAVGGLAF
ncbi:MAG: MBL fold metallo-hydrolase, partial [Chloroflexi bacterium]|nr:MBL fold metallo-hydrolase [Chloroflexota bacterium]